MIKTCFKCGLNLPIDSFYVHPRMADGHLGKCKECTKKDVAANYQKNFAEIQNYECERFKSPSRKKMVVQYAKRRRTSPEGRPKFLARSKLAYQVRNGLIVRPDKCESCGITCKVQAHHEDYSRPYDVKWLCFVCHRKQHGQLKHRKG